MWTIRRRSLGPVLLMPIFLGLPGVVGATTVTEHRTAASGAPVAVAARPHTPYAAAAQSPTVQLLTVGVYGLTSGHEQRLLTIPLSTTVRLKITVEVVGAPTDGISATATFALRSTTAITTYLSYRQGFTLMNGRQALYYDVVFPNTGLDTGDYLYVGTVGVGVAPPQTAATRIHVAAPVIPLSLPMRVSYAHLHLTVPGGWEVDHERDSQGRSASGPDSLTIFANTRRVAMIALYVARPSMPSTAELRALPRQVLEAEFSAGVSNEQDITFKGQIDGHDLFAVRGDGPISGRSSRAIVIVTNKDRQIYVFTLIDYGMRGLPSELRAGLAAIFSATFE